MRAAFLGVPSAPLSLVVKRQMKQRRILGWRIYFALLIAMATAAVVSDYYNPMRPALLDYVGYLVWFTVLAGVFGFCFDRRVIVRAFWRVFLPFVIPWDVGLSIRAIQLDQELQDLESVIAFAVIFALLIVPSYVALFLYGYRSNNLWASRADV